MNSPRTALYRDKQNAKFMGVLSGIADYTGVNALWVRLGMIILTITLGWPILAYILVFGIGTLLGIRAENAIAAAFIVSLQPVAVSLYVSNNLTDAWPKLTELAIGYAMVLPFMIAACIFVIQRRLPFVRRR